MVTSIISALGRQSNQQRLFVALIYVSIFFGFANYAKAEVQSNVSLGNQISNAQVVNDSTDEQYPCHIDSGRKTYTTHSNSDDTITEFTDDDYINAWVSQTSQYWTSNPENTICLKPVIDFESNDGELQAVFVNGLDSNGNTRIEIFLNFYHQAGIANRELYYLYIAKEYKLNQSLELSFNIRPVIGFEYEILDKSNLQNDGKYLDPENNYDIYLLKAGSYYSFLRPETLHKLSIWDSRDHFLTRDFSFSFWSGWSHYYREKGLQRDLRIIASRTLNDDVPIVKYEDDPTYGAPTLHSQYTSYEDYVMKHYSDGNTYPGKAPNYLRDTILHYVIDETDHYQMNSWAWGSNFGNYCWSGSFTIEVSAPDIRPEHLQYDEPIYYSANIKSNSKYFTEDHLILNNRTGELIYHGPCIDYELHDTPDQFEFEVEITARNPWGSDSIMVFVDILDIDEDKTHYIPYIGNLDNGPYDDWIYDNVYNVITFEHETQTHAGNHQLEVLHSSRTREPFTNQRPYGSFKIYNDILQYTNEGLGNLNFYYTQYPPEVIYQHYLDTVDRPVGSGNQLSFDSEQDNLDLKLFLGRYYSIDLPSATGGKGNYQYELLPANGNTASLNSFGIEHIIEPIVNVDYLAGAIFGSPNVAAPKLKYNWRVSDEAGNIADFPITVTIKPDFQPVFHGSEQTFAETWSLNTEVNYPLPEITNINSPINYQLIPALPSGLRLEDNTIVGTPLESFNKTKHYLWIATDEKGDAAVVRLDLQILDPQGERSIVNTGIVDTNNIIINDTYSVGQIVAKEIITFEVPSSESTYPTIGQSEQTRFEQSGALPDGLTAVEGYYTERKSKIRYKYMRILGQVDISNQPNQSGSHTIRIVEPNGDIILQTHNYTINTNSKPHMAGHIIIKDFVTNEPIEPFKLPLALGSQDQYQYRLSRKLPRGLALNGNTISGIPTEKTLGFRHSSWIVKEKYQTPAEEFGIEFYIRVQEDDQTTISFHECTTCLKIDNKPHLIFYTDYELKRNQYLKQDVYHFNFSRSEDSSLWPNYPYRKQVSPEIPCFAGSAITEIMDPQSELGTISIGASPITPTGWEHCDLSDRTTYSYPPTEHTITIYDNDHHNPETAELTVIIEVRQGKPPTTNAPTSSTSTSTTSTTFTPSTTSTTSTPSTVSTYTSSRLSSSTTYISTQHTNNPAEQQQTGSQIGSRTENPTTKSNIGNTPQVPAEQPAIQLLDEYPVTIYTARLPSNSPSQVTSSEILVQSKPMFSDHLDTPHRNHIDQMALMGITQGCNPPHNTHYCPDRTITRGEIATLLSRVLNLPPTEIDHFTDDNTNTHHQHINQLAQAGITQGCNQTNTHYCPNRPISRAEIATLLTRALNLPTPTQPNPYTDTHHNTHQQSINAITQAGITQGCYNNNYCPNRPVTRAEMATFLIKAINHQEITKTNQ